MQMKIAAEPNTQKEETGKYTILTKCKNKFLRKIQKRTDLIEKWDKADRKTRMRSLYKQTN
jgi:hypothetical protein